MCDSTRAPVRTPERTLSDVEFAIYDASRVAGALRAVACIADGEGLSHQRGGDFEGLKIDDLKDLLTVLSVALDKHLEIAQQLISASITEVRNAH
jgi:hypothetical protein